jgi:hypothetical protein
MLATLRDHATKKMMVLLPNAVECFAKIAMTALSSRLAAMGLLPKHD